MIQFHVTTTVYAEDATDALVRALRLRNWQVSEVGRGQVCSLCATEQATDGTLYCANCRAALAVEEAAVG